APALDVASTAASIDAWPRIVPGIAARAVTSFDRSGDNDDGFGGTYSELYVDARGEHVVFDESGPGVLRTLWFTSAISGDGPLGIGMVRFYFDDEERPRIVIEANDLFAGKSAPFVTPLVAANFTSSGGFASWAPLPYRSRLRITTEHRAGFYQAHHDVLPPDWDVASYAPGTSDSALSARFAAATGPSSLPLEEVALDTTRTGAGTIDVLRFVPDTSPSDAALRAARIRIWFDGATEPQVDVPLGFFFGSGLGVAPVQSVAWTMRPDLFESRMPMPFWVAARIQIEGLAGKLLLHVDAPRWTREEAGTLEARFHEETPTASGKDFVYADVTGTGKLVATVLGVDPIVASAKQWWEGDLRTAIDGSRSPSIHGTGHEDDHLGGWSNEFLSRSFTLPMQGCPRTDLLDTGEEFQKNGVTTMYRLWPGIPFHHGIRHSTEHGTSNSRDVNYAAATFLYRQARQRRVLSDAFDVADAAAAAAHGYDAPGRTEAVLSSAFEGESSEMLTATLHEYTSPLEFSLSINPANDGVELRRRFDHAEAPLRNVLDVDGVRVTAVTTWGPVSTTRSWSERDLFIPAQITRGKSRIHVRWVPDTTPKAADVSPRRSNATRFEAWSILN
ncbi:MAG TPA: DUF2961 domain-containing protein, partial [Labilithrix sp.]|nr:DUF2961 domain-containing protein [Labilithrix sp.]